MCQHLPYALILLVAILQGAIGYCVQSFISSHRENVQRTKALSTKLTLTNTHPQSLDDVASTGSSDTLSQPALILFSPCKINLFLRILRKRPDGYHDLASLFQTVGFGDTLHLQLDPNAIEDSMECNMVGVPVDKTNLVLRAIELVKSKTGRLDTFFRANLVKQVPAQAGLGGGSGNAAAAMWGTNVLLGNPATLEQVGVLIFTFVV